MPSRFDNLSEEGLIGVLNSGDFDKEELDDLKKAMERKGLRGTIMAVNNNAEGAEMLAIKEYIDYHQKIPKLIPKNSIEQSKEILFSPLASLEAKKIALVTLAHIAQPDVYDKLKEYNQNPDPDLKVWSEMARQECKSFLRANLLEENIIEVTSLNG